MSETGVNKKRFDKERAKIRKELASIPDLYIDDEPEITEGKVTYLLIKQSKCLNKLTCSLIGLTALLALVTIADIFVRLYL